MSDEANDDKPFEASQKKLDDARKKGEVPRSADLTTAAGYGGFVILATAAGAGLIAGSGTLLQGLISRAPEVSHDLFGGGAGVQIATLLGEIGLWVSPWFVVPAAFAVLAILLQRSFVFAPSKLEPKLSRISILSNAKNKFGRNGLFEFAKSFFKLAIYSVVLGVFLLRKTPEILASGLQEAGPALGQLGSTALRFVALVTLIAASIGVLDFFWQRAEHLRRHRMSRKELTEETRTSEGDPHMKQQRRRKGQEIAMNKMLSEVPAADVVIVNPQHYAVALKWSRLPGSAPECVAKGVDEIAARIREVASEHGVPIHRDPPTARALYAKVELHQQIRPEHFRAVAVAIRFADAMSRKAGKRHRQ